LLRATERKPAASLVEYGMYPSPFARPPHGSARRRVGLVSTDCLCDGTDFGSPLSFPFASQPGDGSSRRRLVFFLKFVFHHVSNPFLFVPTYFPLCYCFLPRNKCQEIAWHLEDSYGSIEFNIASLYCMSLVKCMFITLSPYTREPPPYFSSF
jgi:hypothetical protein